MAERETGRCGCAWRVNAEQQRFVGFSWQPVWFFLGSKYTLAAVLKLSLFPGYVWVSKMVHGYSLKVGLELDSFVSGPLVNIYRKFGRVKDARVLFNNMFA